MKRLTFFALFFVAIQAMSQVSVIPEPVSLNPGTGHFSLSKKTCIVINEDALRPSADFLNAYLEELYGFKLPVERTAKKNSITLGVRKFIKAPENEGHYSLEVTPASVRIDGDSYAGTFYGIQTLIQLIPVDKQSVLAIPAVTVDDQPRFQYRGLMLDAGRHMFPVSFVKKYIDFLALHKMNYFHWHLTEDQGWRIEIKKHPELMSVGAYRNGTIIGRYPGTGNTNTKYGGYYSQEEVKDIVRYAADRYVTVIPEIEMPGHAQAALATYPELGCTGGPYEVAQVWGVSKEVFCAGNEKTFQFLQDVIDEVVELFPAKYLHIGGDECPKDRWKTCPKCQQRMKENNLKDEHQLQSYFVQRMEKYINAKGKTIIGWDEILEGGLAPNAIVMSWRGEEGGIEAAGLKHQVIMTPSPYVYLDYSQHKKEDSLTIGGYISLARIYNYEPVPKQLTAEQAKYILGGQANLWSEYISNPKKMEYMLFPRATALSEVLWSPKEKKDWNRFEKKLPSQLKRYDRLGINYSKTYETALD